MRKRPRHVYHKTQASAACDSSSSSSLCCFPLFYLLLITWIILFTLNPALSHYSGSYSWSVSWLSGVHADVEQKVQENGSSPGMQEKVQENGSSPGMQEKVQDNGLPHLTQETAVLALDESIQEFSISNSRQTSLHRSTRGSPSHPISRHVLKCRPPLLKEVFFCSTFSECCCSSGGSLKKRRGRHVGSNLTCKDMCMRIRKHVSSLHADEGSNESQDNIESQEFQDGGGVEGRPDVDRDVEEGHFVDRDVEHHTLDHIKVLGTHFRNDEDKEHQPSQQIEYKGHDNIKDGMEHYDVAHVDNGDARHTDTHPPPPNDVVYVNINDTTSPLAPSDILNKTHPALTNLSRIHLRQEPGDGPYNYASDSKGAKVLASNKEAKGASNILNKDKDKYFRTPCNVETKYVEMELSEEILVVQIVIANHEFYSSNVREFELWGSSTYPTDDWVSLGKFEAENCRNSQTFSLRESQWVRYLKIQMLSHYGSDFYCTLSMVEVYGVDAIETLLEEWIAEESGGGPGARAPSFQEENCSIGEKAGSPTISQSQVVDKDDADLENDVDSILTQNLENTAADKTGGDIAEGKGKTMEKPQSVYHQTGRPALDAVMKLLMQKVRSLEHNQPLLSHYLEEVDERYREVIRMYNKELTTVTGKLENAVAEIANLNAWLQFMEGKWNQDKLSLEMDILHQIKTWNTDMSFIRNELKRTENKELVALAVSFFSIITVVVIQALMLCASVFKPGKQDTILQLSCSRTLWTVPFLSCVCVIFVLSL